jgi:hypothetical protein
VSQAEIRLVWRKKRHKTDPEYGPEDHDQLFACFDPGQDRAPPLVGR